MLSKGADTVKCEIIINPSCEEKIVIYAKEKNGLKKRVLEELKKLAQETEKELFGYMGDEIVKLNPSDIHYISVTGGKVYAVCEKERYLLKERLYALEEKNLENFVKINQSCLANIRKTERFDTSVSGTLKIRFKNGDTDYVSRRQLKAVKERLGI